MTASNAQRQLLTLITGINARLDSIEAGVSSPLPDPAQFAELVGTVDQGPDILGELNAFRSEFNARMVALEGTLKLLHPQPASDRNKPAGGPSK